MKRSVLGSRAVHLSDCFSLLAILSLLAVLPAHAQRSGELNSSGILLASADSAKLIPVSGKPSAMANESTIPSGTILPVVLRSSFSFDKSKPNQILHGKIAQDVPLPNGSKIPKGSTVEGHIVEVNPATGGNAAQVSIQFDKLHVAGKWIPVVTDLRAIAGFMAVMEAGAPSLAAGEGEVYDWLTTTQIGGDSVYGVNGPVMSAENASVLVGRSVPGGVLARVRAKEGTKCRGAINGNDSAQALWVFSSDACGTYGIEHLTIAHAGRTSPEGTIILASETPNLKLRDGDGLLLRVLR